MGFEFEFRNCEGMEEYACEEACRAFRMVVIRSMKYFAQAARLVGNATLADKYDQQWQLYAQQLRSKPDWYRNWGMHGRLSCILQRLCVLCSRPLSPLRAAFFFKACADAINADLNYTAAEVKEKRKRMKKE